MCNYLIICYLATLINQNANQMTKNNLTKLTSACILFIFILIPFSSYAQCLETNLLDELILTDLDTINRNYLNNDSRKLDVLGWVKKKTILTDSKRIKYTKDTLELNSVLTNDDILVQKLLDWEESSPYYSFDGLTDCSIQLIQKLQSSDQVQSISRGINKKLESKNAVSQKLVLEEKLQIALSNQMRVLSREQEAWYIYASKNREIIKGISISSSNDLFRLAAFLPEDKEVSKNFFQRNSDMDYTGGLKIEILTDYLKISGRSNTKTYQRLFFGADVYTPFFKDTSIFDRDTSYNLSDRPHASFQYFGYGTSGISQKGKYKWDLNIKLGKIGGGKANSLQTGLHQDLSFSPKPEGWGAQVANPGRLGWSVEYGGEWQLTKEPKSIYLSVPFQLSLGSYMTYPKAGLRISNREIKTINSNYIMAKNERRNEYRFKSFYWSFDVLYTRMIHNTMLEGFGVVKTKEDDSDFGLPSKHKLNNDDPKNKQLNRDIVNLNFTLVKQFRNNAIFYRWSAISPETRFTQTNPLDVNGEYTLGVDLDKRWHQWGTIGLIIAIN